MLQNVLSTDPLAPTAQENRKKKTPRSSQVCLAVQPTWGSPGQAGFLSWPWRHVTHPAGRWETTLLDPVFRWGLQHRLGFPAPRAGHKRGRTPQEGKPANRAATSWMSLVDMQGYAKRVSTFAAVSRTISVF